MDPLTFAATGAAVNTTMNVISKMAQTGEQVSNVANTAGKALNKVAEFKNYYKDSSLVEATKLTNVEPITIVSKDLLNNPETKIVLNSLLSMFCGYYLQAVDILTKVKDVEVVKTLDKLQPDRDETAFLLQASMESRVATESVRTAIKQDTFMMISTESYGLRLPTFSRPSMEDLKEIDINSLISDRNTQSNVEERLKETLKGLDGSSNEGRVLKAEIEESLKEVREKLKGLDSTIKNAEDYNKQASKEHNERERFEYQKEGDAIRAQLEREKHDHTKQKTNAELELRLQEIERKKKEYQEVGQAQDVGKVDLDSMVNLSLGRMLNVRIAYTKEAGRSKGDSHTVTIPINVRLLVSSLQSDAITRLMTYNSRDMSFGERIHNARSGQISYIKDLLFAQDVIDEYKRASFQDSSNLLAEITRRSANAKRFGLLSRNPSMVSASTLFVVSDAVVREVESKLQGGKFSHASTRDKVFKNTHAMIIAVVNQDWQTVTFYTRGIALGSTFGFKELEGKTKGNGPDIGDIMKAMTAGQPPSF